MEASAPEKIWVHELLAKELNVPLKEYHIEYTRTDAFIKKAEKFFTEKFEVEDYNDNIDIDGSPIFNYGRFIDDFKKYMEE